MGELLKLMLIKDASEVALDCHGCRALLSLVSGRRGNLEFRASPGAATQ